MSRAGDIINSRGCSKMSRAGDILRRFNEADFDYADMSLLRARQANIRGDQEVLHVVPKRHTEDRITKQELHDYLFTKWHRLIAPEDGLEDDIEIAIYWFANHFHGGQSSDLYSISSTSEYRPGPMTTLETEDETIQDMYQDLAGQFGDYV